MTDQAENTILAIHPGALGDLVLFAQFLQPMREGRTIRLAAGKSKAQLLQGLGAVQETLDYDLLPLEQLFHREGTAARLAALLGQCRMLVSCFAGGEDTALQGRLMRLCGATRAMFLPVRPPADFPGHLLEYWARMVELPVPSPPVWTAPGAWRQAALSQLTTIGCQLGQCPLAVLQPGAGSPGKCWPLERFLELAGELRGGGLTPLLVLGPTETEWWPTTVIESCCRRCSVVQDAPLPVLAGLLAQARVFVGNDSGPGHLAAALGCSVVSLFGPSDPRQFAPRGKVRLLQATDLGQLDVSTVLRAVGTLLD